ncbi:MAG: hypothetical protein LBR21_00450 [Propionibacteriaceae bacterium]|jgi:hypothetical protein|nr:hypothetical protein [Propionibacteriaceae bacterium]
MLKPYHLPTKLVRAANLPALPYQESAELVAQIQAALTVEYAHLSRRGRHVFVISAPDAAAAKQELAALQPKIDASGLVFVEYWKVAGKNTHRNDGGLFPRHSRVASERNWFCTYIPLEEWESAQLDTDHRPPFTKFPLARDLDDPIDAILNPGPLLKYQLRSINAYAPWLNRLWITDSAPSWASGLDLLNPAQLTDHYIYLDDRAVFTRRTVPASFFEGSGIALFATSANELYSSRQIKSGHRIAAGVHAHCLPHEFPGTDQAHIDEYTQGKAVDSDVRSLRINIDDPEIDAALRTRDFDWLYLEGPIERIEQVLAERFPIPSAHEGAANA